MPEITSDDGGSRQKRTNYDLPGNSHKQKTKAQEGPEEPVKKLEKVIDGVAVRQKKPMSRRLSDMFSGEDARSIFSYVFTDVLIPALKDMAYDAVSQGFQRMLFGEVRSTSRRGYGSGGHTNYNAVSSNSRRELSDRSRATHDFDEILLESRAQAEKVIDAMEAIIDTYDQASVADFYELVGVTGTFVDNTWGWTNLSGTRVVRVRDGYVISLPRTQKLD